MAARRSLRGVAETVGSLPARVGLRRCRPTSSSGSFRIAEPVWCNGPLLVRPGARSITPTLLGTRGFAAVCCNKPEGCVHQEISKENPEQRQHSHNTDAASTKPGCSDGEHGSPCWACGKMTGCCNFFCTCGKIQPVVGHCSYFETFHMPKRYDIDVRQLEQIYWDLQMSLHPDRYGQKSRTEQEVSRNNSTYLNVAYKTLKDPTLRAKYLLQLEGINALDEHSKSADPVLLMEIMELRERIESSGSVDEMRDLLKTNHEAIEELKRSLADHYKARDFETMLELTNRLQYLSKVAYEARERLDRLEDAPQHQQQSA